MSRSWGRIANYIRRHHVALLALFFALAGTSYAASNALPKNSVGSKQVINGSLQTVDLSKKAKTALKGARGVQGAQGQRGPTGAQGVQGTAGAQGPPGLANVENVDLQSASDSTSPKILFPSCPGKRAISASGYISNSAGSVGLVALTEVYVAGVNVAAVEADEVGGGTASNWSLLAGVTCADVQ
jgi:hypothetical protein